MTTQSQLNKKNIQDYDLQVKINEKQEEINEGVQKHLAIANSEMAKVQTDIEWIKEVLDKLETRTWVIISGIMLNLLIAIAFQLWK